MSIIYFLLEKEFKQIFRNPSVLAIIIGMPLIQLLIFPLAANYEVKHIGLVVVDHDHSTYSSRLIAKIGASPYFSLSNAAPAFGVARENLEQNQADLILEIPAGFERNLIREHSQQLFIAANAINSIKAGLGTAYLNSIIAQYNGEIRLQMIQKANREQAVQIEITFSDWYNPLQLYHLFMVPGILAFLVTMVTGFLSAMNIVKEKEEGTIEQINVSPIKKHHFILGKLLPFWIIGNVVFSLGLVVSFSVYGIVPLGSMMLLFVFLWVYLLAILGFGLLVSTYCDTQQQAMLIMFFFMLVFILMSGLLTSIDGMPAWAKIVAFINPVTHIIEVCRAVVLKGSSWQDVSGQFLIIGCFAVFFNTWAIWNYRKVN